jgi:tRNA (mo5U34)-methyltransferase
MDITELRERSDEYAVTLEAAKARIAPSQWGWYPYGSLSNFTHLENLLTGANRNLLDLLGTRPFLDIGAADGDTAFFLETLGCRPHVIDYAPTNFNGCRGVRALRDELASSVEITELDLDSQFKLPGDDFGMVLALGLLYHLKNPYYFLEMLARSARYALISTRITRFNVVEGGEGDAVNTTRVEIGSVPAAYLVAPHETNDDPTNFWMFTEAGLRRLLERTGWRVLDFMTVGAVGTSDPATAHGDERAFCLVGSTVPRPS